MDLPYKLAMLILFRKTIENDHKNSPFIP